MFLRQFWTACRVDGALGSEQDKLSTRARTGEPSGVLREIRYFFFRAVLGTFRSIHLKSGHRLVVFFEGVAIHEQQQRRRAIGNHRGQSAEEEQA